MILGHRIQLEPTAAQRAFFARCCGTHRFTWNWALAEAKKHYAETKTSIKLTDLKKQWNTEKPEWVYAVPKDCNQQAFADLQKAYSNFFKGLKAGRKVGHPKFKKRGEHDGFYLSNDKGRIEGQKLYVPLLGWVRSTEVLRWQGKIMSYRVTRQADRWFVSVAVEVGDHKRARAADGIVGVDLGLKSLAVTSDGEVFEAPKPLKKALRRLAHLQRIMARRVKGSVRRHRARMAIAKLHMRIGNTRKDALHKITTKLCRENQAVVVEDLAVGSMVKNRKLARAISDVGWGKFRRQLEYKAPLYGTALIVADRWYPSSKTCSACGYKLDVLPLSSREWICPGCWADHDRDLNAALNLKALAFLPAACGKVTLVDRSTSAPRISRGVSRLVEARSSPVLTREHTE